MNILRQHFLTAQSEILTTALKNKITCQKPLFDMYFFHEHNNTLTGLGIVGLFVGGRVYLQSVSAKHT